MNLFWVFIGGGLGSIVRYLFSMGLSPKSETALPWGTIVANLVACFVLGLIMGYIHKYELEENMKLFLSVGFCGGFSTFSTFSLENWQFLQQGQYKLFAANIFLSLILGIGMVVLGHTLVKAV